MKWRRLYQPSESVPGRAETHKKQACRRLYIRYIPLDTPPYASGSLKNRTSGPWKAVACLCDSPHVLRILIALGPKLTNVARWCLLLTDLCWALVNCRERESKWDERSWELHLKGSYYEKSNFPVSVQIKGLSVLLWNNPKLLLFDLQLSKE